MRREPRISAREVREKTSLLALVGEAVKLRREGPEYVGLCPFHAERTPSFFVNETKGLYHCHGCGAGGDALDFMCEHYGLSFARAVDHLAARLGLATSNGRPPLTPRASAPPPAGDADEAERKARRLQWCMDVWAECVPADGTMAADYLLGRGIDADAIGGVPYDLRFHPGLWHAESKRKLPAMVGRIADAGDRLCGLHRTFLASGAGWAFPRAAAACAALRGGRAFEQVVVKADVPSAKKMAGAAKGGCVKLAEAGRKLAIAEGIETALSVMQEQGVPAWAALSLGNLGGVALPPQVHEVVLCADSDAKDKDAAERQLQAAAHAYERQGATVWIARPPEGTDFNDLLVRGLIGEQQQGTREGERQ